MQDYTVLLQHGTDGPPHVHHVMAWGPAAAYLEAANRQEMFDALASHIGQPQKLTVAQAAFEWPLLMVCEGHLVVEPVLTAAQLLQKADEEQVEEPKRKAS